MKKTLQTLLLAGVLGLSASTVRAAHIKLFVLTGQSNSLGTTNGGEADPSSGTDASDQHVQFFWHNIVNATTTIGTSGGVFTTLQDQQGGVYAGSATHWGGEMEFARTLYRAGVRDFGVIKASRGGGGNTYWLKGSADDHMYVHVTNTVAAATADLTANGHTFEIVGLLYLQGESDSGIEITEAGTRLKTLTDNLRADLPNASNLHTVAAGTTAAGLTSSANQAATASITAYMDTFSNTDLTDRLAPDGLHLNKAGKIVVGNRWAQAFLDAGIVSRHYGKLVFIGDSITQGGNGDHPSYRYQIFKNLANAGVTNIAATGYEFVGSVTGPYNFSTVTTPDVNNQPFVNKHDGHFGWRASWENARVALPAGRYNVNNLGQGTLENWTGQTSTFDTADAGTLAYTAPSYIPDTVVIKIGINDLSDGTSATQIRDDIALLIDQLRAANPNVRIHLSQVLYSNNVGFSLVDALNALLPQLVTDKNAASSTSPVWLITANAGFNPSTMTYDNTHPNSEGEVYVGDRMSVSFGLIEMPNAAGTPLTLEEKASDLIGCLHFEGSDIYNSGSYASGWSAVGGLVPTPTGVDDLQIVNTTAGGSWLEGTSSGWSDINQSVWTWEARLKFDANSNGFLLWLGTDTDIIYIAIYGDRTEDYGANSFSVAHNNLDGNYHTFQVKHDPPANLYYVWRDGILLNPGGSPYDSTSNDSRMIMGDFTSGSFGDGFNITLDYVRYCGGYEGNEMHSGAAFINGWSSVGGISPNIVNTTDLQITNTTAGGSWLEGTGTGWSAINEGYWTFETRLKFDANPNGFILWLGTDTDIAWIEIYANRTQDNGGQAFNVAHNNLDGAFHTFRVGHDPANSVYHVWRDVERLTPVDGANYDSGIDSNQLILGDYTGGTFGNGFDATIDYVRVDTGNVYLPPGADADGDGMSDLFEDTYFGGLTNGVAAGDNDRDDATNLDEYIADTSPIDGDSRLRISTFAEAVPDTWSITVPDTSPRRNYALYASGDIGLSDPWTAVPGQGPIIGTDGDLVFTDTVVAVTSKFYRVEVAIP